MPEDKEKEQRKKDRELAEERKAKIEAEEEERERKLEERKALLRAKQEAEKIEGAQIEERCRYLLGIEIIPRELKSKIGTEPQTIAQLITGNITVEQKRENLLNILGASPVQELSQEEKAELEVYSLQSDLARKAKIMDPKVLNVITEENVFGIEQSLEEALNELSETEKEDKIQEVALEILNRYKPRDTREIAAQLDDDFFGRLQSGIMPLTSGKKVVLRSGIYESFAKGQRVALAKAQGTEEKAEYKPKRIDFEEIRRKVDVYSTEKQREYAEKAKQDLLKSKPHLTDYINKKITLENPEDIRNAACFELYRRTLLTQRTGEKLEDSVDEEGAILQAVQRFIGLTEEEEKNWKETTARLDKYYPPKKSEVVNGEAPQPENTTTARLEIGREKLRNFKDLDLQQILDEGPEALFAKLIEVADVVLQTLEPLDKVYDDIEAQKELHLSTLPDKVRLLEKSVGGYDAVLQPVTKGITDEDLKNDTLLKDVIAGKRNPLREYIFERIFGYDLTTVPKEGFRVVLDGLLAQYVTREECERRFEQYEQTAPPVLPAESAQELEPAPRPSKRYSPNVSRALKLIRKVKKS